MNLNHEDYLNWEVKFDILLKNITNCSKYFRAIYKMFSSYLKCFLCVEFMLVWQKKCYAVLNECSQTT